MLVTRNMQIDKMQKILEIERRFGKDLEEILNEEYVVKGKSTVKLSNEFGITRKELVGFLKNYGIETRQGAQAQHPNVVLPTKSSFANGILQTDCLPRP